MNLIFGIALLVAVVSNSYISASPPPEFYQETTRPPLLPRPPRPVPVQTKPYPVPGRPTTKPPLQVQTKPYPVPERPKRPPVPIQTKPYPVPGRPTRPNGSQFTILPFPYPARPPRPYPSGSHPNPNSPLRPKPIATTLPLDLNSPPPGFTVQPNPSVSPHPHRPRPYHEQHQKPAKPESLPSNNNNIQPVHLNEQNARFLFGNKSTVNTNSSLGVTTLFSGLFG